MDATQITLIGVAVVFGGYLLVQVRPAFSPRGRALLAEVRSSRKRATEATTPELRAVLLAQAGEAAARAKRWVSAAGLFLRALRADPESVSLITRMTAALSPRPRLLGSILERRMDSLSESDRGRRAFIAMARALVDLYQGPLRRRFHAKLIGRLIGHEELLLAEEKKTGGP